MHSDFSFFRDFPEPVFIMEPDGTILDANPEFAARFFIASNDVRGLNYYELLIVARLNPEAAARRKAQVDEVLRTGKHLFFEDESDGRFFRHSIYPVRSNEGNIIHLLIIIQDITGMKQAEHRTQKDNFIFKSLLDAISGAVFIMDDQGKLAGYNEYAINLFGNEKREIPGDNLHDIVDPGDRERIIAKFRNILLSGGDDGDELRMRLHGDAANLKWFSIRISRTVLADRTYLVIVCIDIHERKQAEEALGEHKRWLSLALEAAASGVWEWDITTDELRWSDEVWALYGLEKNIRKPSFQLWASFIHPDDRQMVINTAKMSARNNLTQSVEYRVVHPDGSIHWIMSSGKPMLDAEGRVIRYHGAVIDISRQKRTEDELFRSRTHLDFALEKCHIGWWEIDLEEFTVLRTLEHARIFGYDSLLTEWSFEKFIDHVMPEDRTRIESIITESIVNKSNYVFECRILRASGEMRWIWASGTIRLDSLGAATHVLGIVQDITERKQDEEEFLKLQNLFQQSQKMELVGQLAGGIAHDFNNALTAILGNTELLRYQVEESSPLIENIRDIEKSAEHSAELTRQLLTFARRQITAPSTIRLNEQIEKLLPMLRGLMGSNIKFVWKPGSDGLVVLIDPSQLDQIVVNFCINARDAIDENGIISIETGSANIDSTACAMGHPCRKPGGYVTIAVSDTGCGIDEKTLPHIFEPFFTTKEVGKGTGLGLSTVYGVLKQCHGYIDCRTAEGSGTTFTVYLPVPEELSGKNGAAGPASTDAHDVKTILLVEDEPGILKILKELLEEKGFCVLPAQDAGTAIDISSRFQGVIDLLVTDIVLPDINGVKLSDKLQVVRPELNTLFMSGYAQEIMSHYKILAEGINFIQKPFGIKNFLDIVSRMLYQHQKAASSPAG
jgi:PAS domain S-box-containing protein